MSEKRRRQQERRRRRTAKGRTARDRRSRIARAARLELKELLAGMAEIATGEAHEPGDALEAEQWASSLIGTWHIRPMPGQDVEAIFSSGFVDALEELATASALATLRALAAVAAPEHARRAGLAADRLAAGGLPEPAWSEGLGRPQPTAAALLYEEAFDDGISVMVEFAGAGYELHTLGVYIDHNLGGLVKDVFVAGPLAEVRRTFSRRAPQDIPLAIRDLDLAEARARVEAALDRFDRTYDPPVSEDVRPARALIAARMRLLAGGFALADDVTDITAEQRDELFAEFLASPEGRRWRGDEDAEDVVALAIDFGADYNHGGPLRWSPVVVEIFMTSWLARKVTREVAFFTRVPEVLRDWVTYAGRRRGVPAAPLREAVTEIKRCRRDMLDAVGDPQTWGPAKAFAVAALDAGVDLTDRDQVERFIERYSDGLAA